jgi:hypothetical protein
MVPDPSARHTFARPFEQLALPGMHAMHPMLAAQVCPVAAQLVTVGGPPSPLHTVATLPEQLIALKVPATQGPPDSAPASEPAASFVLDDPQPTSTAPAQPA